MKIFLANSSTQIFWGMMKEIGVKNVLASFAFFKSYDKITHVSKGWIPESLMLDSGAFSVWANNKTIDIDSYVAFVKDVLKNVPSETKVYIVNLDVLPGKFGERPSDEQRQQSAYDGWQNMLYLERQGLKVIPVYHQHEEVKWLQKMMDHTDYIGISPANDVSQSEKERWMDRCFSIMRNNYKTHGFAVTAYDSLIRYPFYSVDSSSWSAGGRFGRIPLFVDGKIKSFMYKDKKDLLKYWNDLPSEYTAVMKTYHDRNRIGILSFKLLEEFITRLWAERGIVWHD